MPNNQHSDASQPPELLRQAYDDVSRCLRVAPKGETAAGAFLFMEVDSSGRIILSDTVTVPVVDSDVLAQLVNANVYLADISTKLASIITLLGGGLPAALDASGGLKTKEQ